MRVETPGLVVRQRFAVAKTQAKIKSLSQPIDLAVQPLELIKVQVMPFNLYSDAIKGGQGDTNR